MQPSRRAPATLTVRVVLAVYLALYFVAVFGAAATVWRSGLIDHLDRGWTIGALAGAVLLGFLLGALSKK